VNDYIIVILATLIAAMPFTCAIAYRIGYNRAVRMMAENRRWEHWLIRNESNRNVKI
jgi:hypothetical protein